MVQFCLVPPFCSVGRIWLLLRGFGFQQCSGCFVPMYDSWKPWEADELSFGYWWLFLFRAILIYSSKPHNSHLRDKNWLLKAATCPEAGNVSYCHEASAHRVTLLMLVKTALVLSVPYNSVFCEVTHVFPSAENEAVVNSIPQTRCLSSA